MLPNAHSRVSTLDTYTAARAGAAGPRACLAGLSLGSRGFRSELKQGELGTWSFYYNYSRCAVLHLSWSESLSSALKGEGAS